MSEWPLVSVVIPMRNEAASIGDLLDCVLAQDYPADRLEVLVVDGASTDDSAQAVERYGQRDPRVRLLANPRRIVPTALNIAIRAARGDIICRIDGHTRVGQWMAVVDAIAVAVTCLHSRYRQFPDATLSFGETERVVARGIAGRDVDAQRLCRGRPDAEIHAEWRDPRPTIELPIRSVSIRDTQANRWLIKSKPGPTYF